MPNLGVLLLMFFAAGSCYWPLTRNSLHQSYGRPTSETYDTGQGVRLTVTFDDDGNGPVSAFKTLAAGEQALERIQIAEKFENRLLGPWVSVSST
jgi:hypothetical protein